MHHSYGANGNAEKAKEGLKVSYSRRAKRSYSLLSRTLLIYPLPPTCSSLPLLCLLRLSKFSLHWLERMLLKCSTKEQNIACPNRYSKKYTDLTFFGLYADVL